MSSSSDEFDYGLVNTDGIEIQPFQFEPLPGASKSGRSRKRRRPTRPNPRPNPPAAVVNVIDREIESSESSNSEESEDEDINPERIGNTDWCDCNHCVSMPTGRESLCCREVQVISDKSDDANCGCITQVGGFTPVCLNADVIVTAIYQYIEDEEFIDDHPTCELFRYISYRQFVRWIWHYLGKNQRKVLPSCVVNKIRSAFPSDEYTGFKYPTIDY